MKRIDTKMKRLSLCLLLAGMAMMSHAQTQGYLYVYAPNGQGTPFALDNIQKITFTADAMQIFPASGSATTLAYTNIARLMFEPGLIGNETIETASDVKVYASGGSVFIESPVEMSTVNLYNLQGMLLQSVAPQSLSASLPLSGQTGIYVVQVFSPKGVSVHKVAITN